MNSIKFLIRVQHLMDALCDMKDEEDGTICTHCPLSSAPYDCDKWDSEVFRTDDRAWANWNIEAVGCNSRLPVYEGGMKMPDAVCTLRYE